MNEKLKCFISASYDTDLSFVKNILAENNIDTFDLYDFSIGDSVQQILKQKLRQADFALFVVSNDNPNVIYEMGVCEGLGKQHFIFLEKDFKIPFYIENKLFIRTDLRNREFLQLSIQKILHSVKKKTSKARKSISKEKSREVSHSNRTKENLTSYLNQIRNLRESGNGRELEYVIQEIFKTIQLNYVENSTNKDKGVDFALWSDKLGKIVGNPIIVEVKYGNLTSSTFRNAEQQLLRYVDRTDAKVAILLYLDKQGRKYKLQSSLNPLIIGYDIEDFVIDLMNQSFESLILNQRNKIAHGIE